MVEGFTHCSGYKLYHSVYGTRGPAVLVLHDGAAASMSLNHRETSTLVDWLWLRRCRVATFDMRGHGRSTPAEAFGPEWFQSNADDACAVLDDLGLDDVTVIGVGDGAVVALNLAIRHPDRVVSVVGDGARIRLTPEMAAARNPKGKCISAPWRRLLEQMHGAAQVDKLMSVYGKLVDQLAGETGDHYDGKIGDVRCPVLLLACDDGRFDLLRQNRQLAELLPNASLRIVEGAGEIVLWSDAGAFRAAVDPFLREHLVGAAV